MKRRLGIAQTLIGGPKIMIIDEPTVGLDPEERVRFRNLLSDLTRQEKTILLIDLGPRSIWTARILPVLIIR